MEKQSQSVDRIFTIIEKVAESTDGLGITDLAKIVDLPKSTVHRIVSSLCVRNYFIKDTNNNKYKLSYRFIAIASDYIGKLDIREVSYPFIKNLATSLNLTTHIAIRNGDKAVYIEKVQPHSHVCKYSEIGRSIDLYCSSLGKSLLLGLNDVEYNNYIDNLIIKPFTKNTLNKNQLIQEINQAKVSLITFDNEEHEENTFCIATPIYDYSNNVIAAISMSSTNNDLFKDDKYKDALLKCGKDISLFFGRK